MVIHLKTLKEKYQERQRHKTRKPE
jgi:hypothetical protein